MKTETTRRAVVAGLAAMPVAGIPAIALAAPLSEALAGAIEHHKAAREVVRAHSSPEDIPEDIVDAETAAIDALAETPCPNDQEFMVKMRYLLANHRNNYRSEELWLAADAREILIALDLHLNA